MKDKLSLIQLAWRRYAVSDRRRFHDASNLGIAVAFGSFPGSGPLIYEGPYFKLTAHMETRSSALNGPEEVSFENVKDLEIKYSMILS